MEEFLIRGWNLSYPGAVGPRHCPKRHWLCAPQLTNYQQSADGGGASTTAEEVLIRVITISVSGLLRPQNVGMYGRVYGQEIRLYPPRVRRDLDLSPSVNFPRATAVPASGNQRSANGGWGFHTVRGGIERRDHRFRPGVVGVVDAWKGS